MSKHYDFVALGGGSAGFNAARAACEHAKRVAVIDGAKELGGLCILRGCMPSKTLIYTAEVLHHARHAESLGLRVEVGPPDMAAIRDRKRRIIGEFADYRQKQLESGEFELIRSTARFVGPHELELSDGARVTADRILIGTGSAIAWPDIPGLFDSKPWTSNDVLDLDFVPESVIVLGGGVVACELSQYLSRLGTRVIQVQRSAHILKEHDPEATSVVEKALRDEGVELFTDTQLTRVSFDGAVYEAVFNHEGREVVRRARHCLNALGRTPATSNLGLDAAGIRVRTSGHIETDAFQQTSVPGVYAAGDCAGPNEIVHIAIQQAEVAVRHAFAEPAEPVDSRTLLQVVFTDPQLATMGATRPALERSRTPYLEASYPFDDHGKSILMEATYGHVRVLADPSEGRLLGAEIVGKDAGELIHAFSVAISANMTAGAMLKAPWYHPTLSEIISYPLEEIVEQLVPQPQPTG